MNIIAKTTAVILEVSSSFYPEKNAIFSPDQSYILPDQQTWVQFGKSSDYICGPSPYINTLNCFSAKFKNFSKSIPIPGGVATTPVFIDNSWVIGTTKGFLFRVKSESEKNNLPGISPESTEFWGSESRQIIENFIPKTLYKSTSGIESNPDDTITKIKNYLWIFPSSSPFTSTPVINNNIVYGITANQVLQAIDFKNGKLLWSMELASLGTLYLANHSLSVTKKRLLIASNKGRLLLLNPHNGDKINSTMISSPKDQENQFPDIVAAPLYTDENHIVVSNSISETKNLALDSFETVWSYPEGSVNTPLRLNATTLILLTTSGHVVSLDSTHGTVYWKTRLDLHSPISTGVLMNDKKTILVATQRGELFALDSTSGQVLASNREIGSVVGNFFKMQNHPDESCLTFSTASFRCFKVKR